MRKNYTSLLALLFSAITLFSIGCTKEGPEGPVGAQGPQGPPGSNGANGATGATGPTGTANVIYSSWYTTVTADWVAGYQAPNNYNVELVYNRTAPGVTQAVLDNGVVLAYGKNFTIGQSTLTTHISPLPYQEAFNGQFYGYVTSLGKITFTYDPIDIIRPTTQIAGIAYRYIIIPGGVSGGRYMQGATIGGTTYSPEDLKKMTYEQVVKLLKIPAQGTNIQ